MGLLGFGLAKQCLPSGGEMRSMSRRHHGVCRLARRSKSPFLVQITRLKCFLPCPANHKMPLHSLRRATRPSCSCSFEHQVPGSMVDLRMLSFTLGLAVVATFPWRRNMFGGIPTLQPVWQPLVIVETCSPTINLLLAPDKAKSFTQLSPKQDWNPLWQRPCLAGAASRQSR